MESQTHTLTLDDCPFRSGPVVYALCEPESEVVRYIGMTTDLRRRCRNHFSKPYSQPKTHKETWINSVLSRGTHPRVMILSKTESAQTLGGMEHFWIAVGRASGWDLTNGTDGGDGLVNPSIAVREQLSRKMKAKYEDPAYRAKIKSAAQKSHSSSEFRANMSAAQKQRFKDPQACARMSDIKKAALEDPAFRAKTLAALSPPEARAKQIAAVKENWQTPEYRAVRKSISEDPEYRAQQSAKMKAVWAKRKEQRLIAGE